MVINGKKIVVKHKTLGFSGRHSWTVYPVTYHDNRYVVELIFHMVRSCTICQLNLG